MAINLFSSVFLTIDIGFRYTKIVKVRVNKKNELSVLNFGIGDTPRGCIKNGEIKSKAPIIKEIAKVLDDSNLDPKGARILISGTNIISRILMVDKVPDAEIDRKILSEVKLVLPINVDEHRIDYKILGETEAGGTKKIKVFITAVSKKIIDSYIQILKDLNLKPLAVDIPANSVSKFFSKEIIHLRKESVMNEHRFGKTKNDDTFAVIDLGSETTIVNILKNRIPEFNRVILRGSSDIDNEILKNLKLGDGQNLTAEKYKKMYGIVNHKKEGNDLEWFSSEATKTALERLIREIRVCFDFYKSRCGGENIGKAYLIGGGSQLKGLKGFMEDKLNMLVNPINVLEVDGISFFEDFDREKVNYLINALGASL
jgi:type IV pilus assembly protein PilM